MSLPPCFSDQYRTRNGREFFLFHFQETQEGEWFFSYSRSPTTSPIPGTDFEVPDVHFTGHTLPELRAQAARFAESVLQAARSDARPDYHLPPN